MYSLMSVTNFENIPVINSLNIFLLHSFFLQESSYAYVMLFDTILQLLDVLFTFSLFILIF